MKVLGLISGGKDSCFNLMHCVSLGHEVVALANLHPEDGKDEIDSFMYQSVGHDVIPLYAECFDLPLYREKIGGQSINQNLDYQFTEKDETEDLYRLIKRVLTNHPDLEAVSTGAILSTYQRTRVENVCKRLGLKSLSFLWQKDQEKLLNDMVVSGLNAILIKVAAIGLTRKDLGKSLAEMQDKLLTLNKKFELHPCGEGGEYETLVLDCPLFKKRIVLTDKEVVEHSSGEVCYLKVKACVKDKPEWQPISLKSELVPNEELLGEEYSHIYHTISKKYELIDDQEETPTSLIPIPLRESAFQQKKGSFLVLGNVVATKGSYNTFQGEAESAINNLNGKLHIDCLR